MTNQWSPILMLYFAVCTIFEGWQVLRHMGGFKSSRKWEEFEKKHPNV